MKPMNTMKKYILIGALAVITYVSKAQQDAHYTQYMYNTVALNPGYAGSRGALTVGGLHRSQWVGLTGAPSSQTFFAHTPLRMPNMGLGLSVVNDKIGPINETQVNVDYSYSVRFVKVGTLAFGAKGTVNLFQPQLATVKTITSNDPLFVNSNLDRSVKPNIGFGAYYYTNTWYVGLSSPHMLQTKMKTGKISTNQYALERRHYFFIAGGVIKVTDVVKLKPTTMIKIVKNAPISIDASLESMFYDQFSFGVAHRWKDSFSGLLNYNITKQFWVGCAYDFTVTRINKVNNGTFELMLRYDFVYNRYKYKSPRYF